MSPWVRVWLTLTVVLFAIAEAVQWLKGWQWSVPAYGLGGLGLAIAANWDRRAGWPLKALGTKPLPAPEAKGGGLSLAEQYRLQLPGSQPPPPPSLPAAGDAPPPSVP